ncbi:MAG: hypothetical protein KDI03_15655 [Anaerolineae bacterium]|nr:hypothetical protein [Anaerolineae bacterium]
MVASRIMRGVTWLVVAAIVLSTASPALAARVLSGGEGSSDPSTVETWADGILPGDTNNGNSVSVQEAVFPGLAPTSSSTDWSSGFDLPGVGQPGVVYAIAPIATVGAYVGGNFTQTGPISANYVARWDGRSWHALGLGVSGGSYTIVYALLNDGHGNLYVGGSFETAGGITAHNIAKWDGSTWSALGAGVNGTVGSLALDQAGNLYVGGSFSMAGTGNAANIAKWDGSNWSALGAGISFVGGPSPAFVTTLVVDPAGDLYAGGWFNYAGQVASSHVARWDGTQWYAVPAFLHITVGPGVTDLQFGRDGQLIIAGTFGGHICKWNGVRCSVLGSGLGGQVAGGANAIAFDDQGNLFVVGKFSTAGQVSVKNAAMWDGTGWRPLGAGLDGSGLSVAMTDNGEVLLGGSFLAAGAVAVSGITSWDGVHFHQLGNGNGVGGYIHAMARDQVGNLFVGGYFSAAGTAGANNIARWDGSRWFRLGGGVNGAVNSLAIDDQGNLYAGGSFVSVEGVEANRVAKWNGHTWQPLLTGMDGVVNSLTLDGQGYLYAGGSFRTAGGVDAKSIAKWDGARWSPLGDGMNRAVYALVIGQDGSLYAGGAFDMAGGISANHIARWNGTSWSALGEGMDGEVNALAVDHAGQIYAGGSFAHTGGITTNGIARWDGSRWYSVGSGVSSGDSAQVSALTIDDANTLYIGGYFDVAGATLANNIAKWQGNGWQALGSGVDSVVDALHIGPDGHLYVGGSFSTAGNRPSVGIALWGAVDRQCGLTTGSYSFLASGRPVVVNIRVPGTIDCIGVEAFNRVHPWATPTQATDHYWEITATNSTGHPATGYTVDLTLPTTFTPDAEDTICRYADAMWNCAASSFNVSNKTITRNGVDHLSSWTIGISGQSWYLPYLP